MGAVPSVETIGTAACAGSSTHPALAGPPASFYARIGKPIFDRTVAAAVFLFTLPVLVLVAVAVVIVIGPPVVFRQQRVGRGGDAFAVLKFRTMRPDRRRRRNAVIEDRRTTHKSERDPRHTVLGRQLRKWSLDELPQLWNVLRGDMSLVGPRPELLEVVERYEPWQCQRHLVRPGITGLWQVSKRGAGLMHLYTDVDLEYVATMSFRRDLGILLRTIPAALARSGR